MDHSENLCLSQKLSQVFLHNDACPEASIAPRQQLDHGLGLLAEDEVQDTLCSQDFFCTPDFLTPVEQQFSVDFEGKKENVGSVCSPLKSSPVRSKRPRPETLYLQQQLVWSKDSPQSAGQDQPGLEIGAPEEHASVSSGGLQALKQTTAGYIPPNSRASLSAMRRRVLSPPCFKNPFLSQEEADGMGKNRLNQRLQTHLMPVPGCLSRYREEFHEIQEIGRGNFSCVYKVLKRIDGCLYAVKRSHRQLRRDSERRQALTEVQALAAIGFHENIVRYYSAWFENDHLYIQMELCDGTLRNWKHDGAGPTERFLVEAMRQVAQALAFIHSCRLAHLDVKPDNIYFLGNTFKLGDFGRATRLDGSISIEEGDARYMPLEIINDDYSHIPKSDMFALGASIYELARNLPLPSSGTQFQALRQGKIPLLPGFSLPFQNVLKILMHPNPVARPTAQNLLKHSIFRIGGLMEGVQPPPRSMG